MHHNASAGAIDRLGRGGRVRAISATYRYARRHGDRFGVPAPVYTPEDRARFALYAEEYRSEQDEAHQCADAFRDRADCARVYFDAGMWRFAARELVAGLIDQDAARRARDALDGAEHLGNSFRCLVDGARRAQPKAAAAVELARAARIVAAAIRAAGLPSDFALSAAVPALFEGESERPSGFAKEPPVPRVRGRQLASLALTPRLLAQRPVAPRG